MLPDPITPLTLEEHRQLGVEMKTSTARMRVLCEMIAGVYGAHSVPAFHFAKAVDALEHLTSELERQAAHDLQGMSVQGIYR